jgi:hypothetical protein
MLAPVMRRECEYSQSPILPRGCAVMATACSRERPIPWSLMLAFVNIANISPAERAGEWAPEIAEPFRQLIVWRRCF